MRQADTRENVFSLSSQSMELSSVAAVKRITKRLHGNTRLPERAESGNPLKLPYHPNPKVDIASLKVDVLLLRTLPGTVLY